MLCLYFHFTKQAIDSKALKPATDFFALARWSDDSTKWVHAWTQMVNRVRQSVWTRRIFIWGKRECTIVIGPQHESWNSRWNCFYTLWFHWFFIYKVNAFNVNHETLLLSALIFILEIKWVTCIWLVFIEKMIFKIFKKIFEGEPKKKEKEKSLCHPNHGVNVLFVGS